MSVLSVLLIFCVAGVCVSPLDVSAKEKEKEPKVSELLRDANEMMAEAQAAYVDGKTTEAIEHYRKALDEISRVERENPRRQATSEFAPLRFRKALCETEIDRIMLESANASARTVAVTDTSALEAKRLERKRAAETNSMQTATVKLGAKQVDGSPVADVAPKVEPSGAAGAEAKVPDIRDDLELAKDMLTVDRFEDVERVALKVLKQEPENREARFLMALARVQQSRHVDAAVVLDDLLADNPEDEPALLLAAGVHVAAGNLAKAMVVLDCAMKVNPKRPEGYSNMAWLLLEMNPAKTDEPELYYRQSVKLGGARDRDLERRLGIKTE